MFWIYPNFAHIFVENLNSFMILHSKDISQVLTKYFYINSQLCYEILIQTNEGKTFVVEDYTNYTDYKRAVMVLEEKLNSGTVIEVKQYSVENSMLGAVA
jgi:hypothetical protein